MVEGFGLQGSSAWALTFRVQDLAQLDRKQYQDDGCLIACSLTHGAVGSLACFRISWDSGTYSLMTPLNTKL